MRSAFLLVAVAACSLDDKDDGEPPPPPDAQRIDAPNGFPIDAPDPIVVDARPPGNAGFPVPTAVTRANTFSGGAWTEVGNADWSCLGTPSPDPPSTQNLALSGKVRDFQNDGGVGPAIVTAFPGAMTGGNLGMATSDGAAATRGDYAMTLQQLPAGQTRVGFEIEAPMYLRTYVLNQFFAPATAAHARDLSALSVGTTTAIVAFIGEQFDAMTATTIGSFRDCGGRAVSNAVATVSRVSGAPLHVNGASTFYFSAASSSLPVRHNVAPVMNKDGLFVVIDLTPQPVPAFIQVWGFRTSAELAAGAMTLLAELPAPLEPMAIVSAPMEPRRS